MITARLSEETRYSMILVCGKDYDLHIGSDGWYYICKHGTYDMIACMTRDFYLALSE